MTQKEWSGERLEKHITNETMLEHLHRYALACDFANGKMVLDIACGEGYGCQLLSNHALKVTGVDIDPSTIIRAKQQYSNSKINFLDGSIEAIPCPDKSFDLVTCFETLEHISGQEQALKEIRRVLKPGGVLLISTPEKANYSDKTGYRNPFHAKELYENEFRELLAGFFAFTGFYKQQSIHASLLLQEKNTTLNSLLTGDYTGILKKDPPVMYHFSIAADQPVQLPGGSLFYHQQSVTEQVKAMEMAVKQTITYRAGHILLYPFKAFRSLFRK